MNFLLYRRRARRDISNISLTGNNNLFCAQDNDQRLFCQHMILTIVSVRMTLYSIFSSPHY